MRKVLLFIVLIVLSVVVWLIIYLVDVQKTVDSYGSTIADTTTFPKSYKQLLNGDSSLSLYITTQSKYRAPISDFVYNKRFYIKVFEYETDSLKRFTMKNVVVLKNKNVDQTYDTLYNTFLDDNPFDCRYKAGPSEKISGNIYLTASGNDVKNLTQNDSIAYYHLRTNKFNIRFSKTGNQDIYSFTKNNVSKPIEILFFKYHYHIYILMMVAKDQHADLPDRALYGLIRPLNEIN